MAGVKIVAGLFQGEVLNGLDAILEFNYIRK